MFEKVNPSHPDKVADRIAGAIVDLCYTKSRNRWSNESSAKLDLSTAEGRQRWAQANPKVACEVLIGHGQANIQVETSEQISAEDIGAIVRRIAGEGIETIVEVGSTGQMTTKQHPLCGLLYQQEMLCLSYAKALGGTAAKAAAKPEDKGDKDATNALNEFIDGMR